MSESQEMLKLTKEPPTQFNNYRMSQEKYNIRHDDFEQELAIVTGYPIVFNRPSEILGDFVEIIKPTAINDDLLKNIDINLYFNHEYNALPLARAKTQKLELKKDDYGVFMKAYLNLKKQYVKDVYLSLKDGDIHGMSFSFRTDKDRWTYTEDGNPLRVIEKISRINEVSFVTSPAYSDTFIETRNLDGGVYGFKQFQRLQEIKEQAKLEKIKIGVYT